MTTPAETPLENNLIPESFKKGAGEKIGAKR
jgi:hypothetical protein